MPFSAVEFFHDSPWLKILEHRRAEIVIEPLYPRLGLLGGAANAGKMSKLAALAAKRRQKENQPPASEPRPGSEVKEEYLSDLKKLEITPSSRAKTATDNLQAREGQAPSTSEESSAEADRPKQAPEATLMVDQNLRGRPSKFASIMTNHGPESQSTPSTDFLAVKATAKSFSFAEPSPDDIVTKAQSAKAASSATPKTKDPAKPKTTLNNSVQALSIQDTPKIKSKHIDVLAEYKKTKRKNAANFVVIGKSTLMGRLLFELKAVDQRTMEKYRQEAERIGKGSFAFAWVLDQGTEERARGVTIDIATNKFETDKTSFTILDAPGHRDFVPNMIAGASQADFAVLVIDASTGNFESGLKGQTKEHALLVRSIGVQRIIVAVNKMDVADWSQERFTEIRQQMAAFLSSAGFQSKNITFVPCSGLEGGNILTKTTNAKAAWYDGPTLVEELDNSEPLTYALDKALRLTISDIFRHSIQNPLSVSGRLDAGAIQVGEEVVIMPSGEKAQIRSLLVDDEPQDWAVAGQNVIMNLTDIDPIHLKSGDVLCSTLSPIRNITECKAKILAFDHLTPMNVDVHKGRLHVPGRISQLVGILDKATGATTKKRPKIVQPGSVVRVMVQLDQAVPLEPPARIVLRANGETVGAGLIE
ncbi:HBS1-like protein [Cladophialophora carrionii]|uniref:Elongation factor 1 alpha-like protein n=1 Tax=Cladophialophora carrionii TaxID=86049 RepID=A0A1C1CIY8_9EURO|nr:HBS1-like protein [Cladophialophora carrionii]